MTLNITTMNEGMILQVSDRRMMTPDHRVIDDDANKAIVVAASDGIVSVTFSGIGELSGKRIDEQLGEFLMTAGVAELGYRDVLEGVSYGATRILGAAAGRAGVAQVFVAAVFRSDDATSRPLLFTIANTDGPSPGSTFTIEEMHAWTLASGFTDGFDRLARRHLDSMFRRTEGKSFSLETVDEAERGVVAVMQGIAQRHPEIGARCMVLLLLRDGGVRASYYDESGVVTKYGPTVVWYSGGRNFIISDPQVLEATGAVLRIGGTPSRLNIMLGHMPQLDPSAGKTIKFSGRIMLADAVHRREDPLEMAQIMGIIHDNGNGEEVIELPQG